MRRPAQPLIESTVFNRDPGYGDANPTMLIRLSPGDSAPLDVEMIVGAAGIIAGGKALYDQGKYRRAQEILNKLVYADPGNPEARDLTAVSNPFKH